MLGITTINLLCNKYISNDIIPNNLTILLSNLKVLLNDNIKIAYDKVEILNINSRKNIFSHKIEIILVIANINII